MCDRPLTNTANVVPTAVYRALDALKTAIWVHDSQTLRPLWANRAALELWRVPSLEAFLSNSSVGWSHLLQYLIAEAESIRQGNVVQQQHALLICDEFVGFSCTYSKAQLSSVQDVILVEANRCLPNAHSTSSLSFDWKLMSPSPLQETENESVKAATDLHHISNQFKSVLATSPAIIYTLTAENLDHPTFISDNLYAITGYSPDAAIQNSQWFIDCIHPDDFPSMAHRTERWLAEGALNYVSYIYRFKTADGRWIWINDQLTAIRTSRGELELVGALTDVTSYMESDRRLEQISRNIPGMIYQYRLRPDGSSHFPYVSQGIQDIYGVLPSDVAQDASAAFAAVHPEDIEQVKQSIRTSAQTLQTWQCEYRVRFPDGQLRWVSGQATPEAEPGGSVLWHGYIKDISDRKQAELALQRQKEILEALFDQISVMLAFCDQEGRVKSINHELENALGWSLEDWQQRDIFRECYPDSAYRQKVLQHMQTANGLWQDFKTRTASGAIIDTSWSNIRLSDGSIIGIGQNISNRKQIEERLRQRGKRDRLLGLIIQRIRQSLDLNDVLDTAVSEIRAMLNADRVIIYRFESDGEAIVVAESVSPDFLPLLGQPFPTPSQSNLPRTTEQLMDYTRNIANVQEALPSDPSLSCFVDLNVQALLALPIIRGDLQWGGLAVQQCAYPRVWQLSETDLLTQLTNQIAIAIQQSEFYQQLQQSNQELQYLASHDPLTQLANRRHFDTYLAHEWHRLARSGAPLAILVCDVDYFKAYNDTYGHIAGDECLVAVAQAIRQAIKRPSDLVARYGGEEFAIILPDTPTAGAIYIAQTIQQAIQDLQIPHSASPIAPYLTLSLGISVEHPQSSMPPQWLLSRADRALYTAKAEGRNQYRVEM